MRKNIILAILVVAVVGIIAYLEIIKPSQGPVTTVLQTIENASTTDAASSNASTTSSSTADTSGTAAAKSFLASRASTIATESKEYQAAPEIADPSGFINTAPFKLSDFVGKDVVLVDFWTYSCINCVRTIPYLNAWYQKYSKDGLVIVGIHTPEFDFEHDYANVAAAVKQYGIQYPVVLDNNMGTWNAYQNLYWPHEYLINIDGFITYDHVGEGDENQTESAIQSALAQRAQALGIPNPVANSGMTTPTDTIAINYAAVQTPETYFGAERNGYLANGPVMTNGIYNLTIPSSTSGGANPVATGAGSQGFYLGGTWNFADQYATNQTANATILYNYSAKNVYMVAASASPSTPVTVQVLLDGKSYGTVTIQANQLYPIIQGNSYGSHTLELIVKNPGLQAYTFTFG
jgi:thiol-disulfide isomerase/thioredoxin